MPKIYKYIYIYFFYVINFWWSYITVFLCYIVTLVYVYIYRIQLIFLSPCHSYINRHRPFNRLLQNEPNPFSYPFPIWSSHHPSQSSRFTRLHVFWILSRFIHLWYILHSSRFKRYGSRGARTIDPWHRLNLFFDE